MLRLLTLAAAALGLAAGIFAVPARAQVDDRADRRIQVGDPVDDVELQTIDGRRDHLLVKGMLANVFIFFRPQQEHSIDTLKDLTGCEKDFAGKPVRFVGVVSDSWTPEEVKDVLEQTKTRMSVLVDKGDELYGKLGIRLHPVICIVDSKRKLAAFEPFREINYCDRIRVRIRYLLGEVKQEEIAKVDNPAASPLPHSDEGVSRRHVNFARMLLKIGQKDKALEEVRKALTISPSAAAYAMEGEILAAMGKCSDAARSFGAALKIEPANAVAKEGMNGCGK